MAKSPIDDAANKWIKRIGQAQAAGIPLEHIKPLVKYDMQKVMDGGQGMADMEANVAMLAAGSGKSVIGDPKPKTGVTDIIGNIPSDVTGIVKGFIPGLVHDITHIDELPGGIAKAAGEIGSGKLSQGLQDLAKTPGLNTALLATDIIAPEIGLPLTAGVYGGDVAAKATTAKGREEMAQHPVGTLLEALPAASEIGRVATAGRAVEAGSAAEALQQGNPLKAAARAIPVGSERPVLDPVTGLSTGKVGRPSLATKAGEIAQSLGVDHITRELSRRSSILGRKASEALHGVIQGLVEKDPNLTPERAQVLYDAATGVTTARGGEPYSPLDPNFTPEEHAVIKYVRSMNELALERGIRDGTHLMVHVEGKDYAYPINHYVAKRYQAIGRLGEKIANESDPEKVARLQQQLVTKQKELVKAVHTPTGLPAQLHDFTEAKVRAQLEQHIRTSYQADSVKAALQQVQEGSSWQDFTKAVGTDEFQHILHSSINSALDMAKNGFDPLWLHHVPVGRYDSGVIAPKPLSESYMKPETARSRILNFSPHEHDIAFALIDAAREQLGADATKEMVDRYIKPMSVGVAELKKQAREALRSEHEGNPEALRGATSRQLNERYRAYDPSGPFTWKHINEARDTDLAIKKEIADNIDKILGQDRKLQVQGAWDRTLKVYKFSVLTGPRHIVHVGIGGLAFMAIRDPQALGQIVNSIKAVRDHAIPAEVPTHLYEGLGDNLYNAAAGKTLGRMVKAIPDALRRFEEYTANVQRGAVYLQNIKRGADVEAAAYEAMKTFVSLDDMTPFERAVSKNLIPFYAFTRHLFRYLFTLPVDHPARAAILSRFAEQEQQDWNSGLPQKFQQMFFMGSGDNVTGVDFKAINPFRSFGNDFSLAGFMSSLNPAAQVGMELAGINPLSATPELYPQISYDTQTGTLQASRPHSKDWPAVLAETFLPPTQAIDHFVAFSDRMRNLRKSSPESYRRQLFSALNLPFDVATVNKPLARSKAEIARYQAAQRALSEGERSGTFTEAERYNLVPFRGQLVSPQRVSPIWEQLQQLLGQINPKAVLTPYRGRRR